MSADLTGQLITALLNRFPSNIADYRSNSERISIFQNSPRVKRGVGVVSSKAYPFKKHPPGSNPLSFKHFGRFSSRGSPLDAVQCSRWPWVQHIRVKTIAVWCTRSVRRVKHRRAVTVWVRPRIRFKAVFVPVAAFSRCRWISSPPSPFRSIVGQLCGSVCEVGRG